MFTTFKKQIHINHFIVINLKDLSYIDAYIFLMLGLVKYRRTETNRVYHINWKSNRIWNTFQWITPIWPNTVEWSFTHSTLWFNSEQTEKTMRLSCGWWVDYRFRIGEIYLPLHLSNECLCSRRYKVWTMNQVYFKKTFCVGSRMVNLEPVMK